MVNTSGQLKAENECFLFFPHMSVQVEILGFLNRRIGMLKTKEMSWLQ